MSESDVQNIILLLYVVAGILILLVFVVWRLGRRLSQMEKWMHGQSAPPGEIGVTPSMVEAASGGAFESFLGEDPSRRSLPKSEQFAEYRKWRQERGLNWTNS